MEQATREHCRSDFGFFGDSLQGLSSSSTIWNIRYISVCLLVAEGATTVHTLFLFTRVELLCWS
jgi:hypothetical protein